MKSILHAILYGSIFAIPFIVLIISESLFFPFITGKNFTFRILVEIMVASWALVALYDARYRPRFSWILAAFGGFVAVMFFANLFGEYPFKSFWSNFERMEGYVTLVHVFLFFLVAGSTLRVEVPRWVTGIVVGEVSVLGCWFLIETFRQFGSEALFAFPTGLVTLAAPVLFGYLVYRMYRTDNTMACLWNATLGVSVLLAWYALAQFLGAISVSQGASWRIDGTLGNSTYMAVYALFHICIAAILFVRTHAWLPKSVYGLLALTYVFILVQTGTRGAMLGLAGGTLLALIYIALFAEGRVLMRRVAIGGLVVAVLIVGLFVAFRDSAFVQNDPRLSRIASITLAEGQTRFAIWTMAFEGVMERPILGWGQGNYDYVFNKYYKPELWGQEPWFDRVHNIVLDWLVAGGFVGAILYFGIFGAALWYLIIVPLRRPNDAPFDVLTRGLLLGLLGGYTFHNLFVFDNIVSYIFFAFVLAYVHGAVGEAFPKLESFRVPDYKIQNVYAPIAGVLLVFVIYVVNVPHIKAAADIIDAFTAAQSTERLREFERALERNSFANQEIREQMMQLALRELQRADVPEPVKQQWFARTEAELIAQTEDKPGDARGLLLLSSFYRMTGNPDQAREQLAAARTISPKKQQIIFEQGFVELQDGNTDEGLAYFREAYELAPEYPMARVYYALAQVRAGEMGQLDDILETREHRIAFAENDIAIRMLYENQSFELLLDMLTLRSEVHPEDIDVRVNLAALHAEMGNIAAAIDTLEAAIADIPSFEEQGKALITKLQTGSTVTE